MHKAESYNTGEAPVLYSGDCGNDMFKYVLRKFLLANRVGAAQEAGKPSDVAA